MWVYLFAWTFLGCFKLFTLLNPKWEKIIEKYEEGHVFSAATIGFASGLIFEIVFFLFTFRNIDWRADRVMLLPLIYLMIGLMGLLSLVKLRDYEKEK
jgi:hypothetical protein